MSESEAALRQQGGDAEDCPLCLEPMPPFWDMERRATSVCCGKDFCDKCKDKQLAFINRSHAEGTYGRQEEQLDKCCSLCRAQRASGDNVGRILADKYEKGQLPLHLYGHLGTELTAGLGGVEMNVERAIEILMLGAEKGDPNCQYFVGARYQDGRDGLPESPSDAKRWLLAATEQGHAKAEFRLACLYEGDEYVRFMRGSASKGYDEACYNMGVAHYYGNHGLRKSSEETINMVSPAAERGHADSMSLLGLVMCQPDPQLPPSLPTGVDFTKGMHWLRRAAATGHETCIEQWKAKEEAASSICYRCHTEAPPEKAFLRCSRCRAAWYCSKDCQVQHWSAKEGGHKQCCIKWK